MSDKSIINQHEIEEVLKTIYDPEIPVNIFELGLIYDIEISDDKKVDIKMTLTTPNCPAAGSLPVEVEQKINALPGVNAVQVEIVWDPVWNPNMMSDAARLQLGM